jgi:hypothetical protein
MININICSKAFKIVTYKDLTTLASSKKWFKKSIKTLILIVGKTVVLMGQKIS